MQKFLFDKKGIKRVLKSKRIDSKVNQILFSFTLQDNVYNDNYKSKLVQPVSVKYT